MSVVASGNSSEPTIRPMRIEMEGPWLLPRPSAPESGDVTGAGQPRSLLATGRQSPSVYATSRSHCHRGHLSVRGSATLGPVGARGKRFRPSVVEVDGLANHDDVTKERVLQLLAAQAEHQGLDYKQELDLAEKDSTIELAKDVGALAANGGHIVIGALDDGSLSRRVTAKHLELLDESKVRAKLKAYLPSSIQLRIAHHEIDHAMVAVVWVEPHHAGFAVFKKDGDTSPGKNPVFRAGDVFVRHGTASERWQQEDVDRIYERHIEHRRERWRAEMLPEMQRMAAEYASSQIATGPIDAISWQMEEKTFSSTVVELLRQSDRVGALRLLDRAVSDIGAALAVADSNGFSLVLSRLVDIIALATAYSGTDFHPRASDCIARVYNIVANLQSQSWHSVRSHRQLNVAVACEAIGALAVRRQHWNLVSHLASAEVDEQGYPEAPYLLRHAHLAAARSGLLEDERRSVSLVTLAEEYAKLHSSLRPDGATDDEVLTSVCQFDALACLVVMGRDDPTDFGSYWPGFLVYYARRVEPAIRRLVFDREMREAIFPRDNQQLADALHLFNRTARTTSFAMYGGWEGFRDPSVVGFLRANPTASS